MLPQLACSGFRVNGPGFITVNAYIDENTDDAALLSTQVYTNETGSHKATIPVSPWWTPKAGSHEIRFAPAPASDSCGFNDLCSYTLIDFP